MTDGSYFKHETSIVDNGVKIGDGTKIWHFSHILSGTTIGKNVSVGQNVVIGPKVSVGDGCKIQNNVSLYEGVEIEEGVFCGPSCVFTNVTTPRAMISRREEFAPTRVRRHASIGANSTIVCGHELGEFCFIAAGSVVTKNVPPHALMMGNPARQRGWVSHSGEVLRDDLKCARTGDEYSIIDGGLVRTKVGPRSEL
jgi:UDP-2-acetamido-3-amino-2,3-dideoxy-glucuronate N-acetyltransferase